MSITPIRPAWKGTMTGRERFNRQMHYQSVDRCFNMEFGYWDENFTEWKMFVDHGITNNREADIFFNFDKIQSVGGQWFMCPYFEQKEISRTADHIILQNEHGLIAEVPISNASTIPVSYTHLDVYKRQVEGSRTIAPHRHCPPSRRSRPPPFPPRCGPPPPGWTPGRDVYKRQVLGDPMGLEQMVTNLTDNAIKYTPEAVSYTHLQDRF